ncbi:hypothetical protein HPO96_31110 [Kribbella sandramycini]|uniref:Trypsin n=1 Tax=Kribbella sandramycini TaxID=60450 RepID=A0A7Y4L5E5_9ACTN|nr:hypothetical protein [Kribbella sandramycini]MBB6566986.1 hypothetical protein [Kribbella sandramycini]NOL44708.1 hypothetical protein [Kribbella sandramycini]
MRKFGVFVAISAALVAAGGVPVATAKVPAPTPELAKTDLTTLRSGDSLEKIRAALPAANYAGAYVTDNGVLRVLVTKAMPLPKLSADTDAPVEVVKVTHSLAALDARMAQVFAARDKLSDAKSQIVQVDVNEPGNALEIAVHGPSTPELRERVAALAPGTPLEFVPGPAPTEDDLHYSSRVEDFAPWSSGTFIHNNWTGGVCTSGPGLRIGSNEYMLTAGHCGRTTGELIQQGHPGVLSNLPSIGRVSNRSGYPNLDAMVIPTNMSPTMYRTWYNFHTVQATPWESLTGQTVCTGGAFTGESCNLKIGRTNFCSDAHDSCGLTQASRAGAIAAGQGDSGGPVYIVAPGLRYSGIVTGPTTAEGQFVCSSYPTDTRWCSSSIVFTRIQNVLTYYGASLAVS